MNILTCDRCRRPIEEPDIATQLTVGKLQHEIVFGKQLCDRCTEEVVRFLDTFCRHLDVYLTRRGAGQ